MTAEVRQHYLPAKGAIVWMGQCAAPQAHVCCAPKESIGDGAVILPCTRKSRSNEGSRCVGFSPVTDVSLIVIISFLSDFWRPLLGGDSVCADFLVQRDH
jgi:hypothetical protein